MVKTQFSIKDLENLSGVKAHTIRIWEKRYNLLLPERSETNIRQYNIDNLKRLLNISILYNEGEKISKIATLKDPELCFLVHNQLNENNTQKAIHLFKTAMLDFDNELFAKTYETISRELNFSKLFELIFIPFLKEVGLLWQTGAIDFAHEHFISELIKQKLIVNINKVQKFPVTKKTCFSLFLPYNEIHEIGLLYTNYYLLSQGFETIYLGANIPLESLNYVMNNHENIIFIAYCTVKPDNLPMKAYFRDFLKKVCKSQKCELWVMGQKTDGLKNPSGVPHVTIIKSHQELSYELSLLN